jgi:hypothetical protein
VQADFVDVPRASLARADALITRVMAERGYPMKDFDEQADLVSVDHPQVVEHYRRAHGASNSRGLSPSQDLAPGRRE